MNVYALSGRVVKCSFAALYVVVKRHHIEELRRFGANLRRERSGGEITQQKLAEMVDLNVRTIQKIEAGKINILITTAMRLQKALKCPWGKLCSEKHQ